MGLQNMDVILHNFFFSRRLCAEVDADMGTPSLSSWRATARTGGPNRISVPLVHGGSQAPISASSAKTALYGEFFLASSSL